VLSKMYSDEGIEFWDGVCVPCAEGKVGKGDGSGMFPLWMSWVCK